MAPRLILLLALSLLPAILHAQEAEPTPEQKELNREAFNAMKAGDVNAAIAAYEKVLELGALNVTYLNLGRAQQKAGRCGEAWAAFDEVENAPAVPKPDRATILVTLAKFRKELTASCPTTIQVTCAQGAWIRIDEDHNRECPAIVGVKPGMHRVELIGQSATIVEARPGRQTDVQFDQVFADEDVSEASEPQEASPPTVVVDEIPPPPTAPSVWDDGNLAAGIVLVAVGSTLLASSLFADGAILRNSPAYANDHRVTASDFIPIAGYALSASVLTWGIIKLVSVLR